MDFTCYSNPFIADHSAADRSVLGEAEITKVAHVLQPRKTRIPELKSARSISPLGAVGELCPAREIATVSSGCDVAIELGFRKQHLINACTTPGIAESETDFDLLRVLRRLRVNPFSSRTNAKRAASRPPVQLMRCDSPYCSSSKSASDSASSLSSSVSARRRSSRLGWTGTGSSFSR